MLILLFGSSGAYAITEEPVNLEVWVSPCWQGVYSPLEENAAYGDFFNAVAKDYMAQHPNVKIDVVVYDTATREEKISTAVQTNTQPNIIFDAPFLLFDYAHAGCYVPLDDIIDDATRADIPESTWKDVSLAGNVYMYPFTAETGHLAINMDIVEKAGCLDLVPEGDIVAWTPEQFRTLLEGIAKANLEGVYPYVFYCGSTAGDTWTNLELRAFGAQFFSEDSTQVILNSAEGVKALDFYLGLKEDGLVAPGGETMGVQDAFNMFFNGQVAVAPLNNLNYSSLVANWENGSVNKFNLKFAYFPNENAPTCFFYTKGSCVFNTNDVENEVAKDFVKFYSNEPYTKASLALSPLRSSVIATMEDKTMAALSDSLKNAVSFNGGVPGYLELRTVFFPEIQAAWIGDKDAQTALNDYAEKANAVLSKYASRSVLLNKK